MRHPLITAIAATTVAATGSIVAAGPISSPNFEYVAGPSNAPRDTLVADGMTGFEAPDFVIGELPGQNGWAGSSFTDGSLAVEANITDANPASGTQHLRITDEPDVASGEATFAFSPTLAEPTNYLSVDVNVSAAGGANYIVQPQAPSEGMVFTIVQFDWEGTIFVADNPDGLGAVYVDTGVAWTPGAYHTLEIESDGSNIVYSLDDSPIYTGVVWAGSTIEEVLLGSDNFQLAGESGDFDNLSIVVPEPATASLMAVGALGLLRRRRA